MEGRITDPRFNQFQEEFDSLGAKVGFKLPGNPFIFVYDQTGGWKDQEGKYYQKDGVLWEEDQSQESEGQAGEDVSDVDDEQIVDQFQQILMEQEQGIISKREPKKIQPVTETKQLNIDEQVKKYIQQLSKQEQLRQGISPLIHIFFKIRSNLYERVTPQVQKKQDLKGRNEVIMQKKVKIQERRKSLLQGNTWLQGEFLLQYSGISLQQGTYDRYWYGWVKVQHKNFLSTVEQIKSSKQFALLKTKTFYALKSKFYLKTEMKEQIKKQRDSLDQVAQDGAVLFKINNLPQEFPLSFILDLIELSGGYFEDVQDINIVDNFSCDLIVKKRTAVIITRMQGYAHDEKEYIWIQVSDLKRPIKSNELFNIQVEAQYKNPIRQTADTLALTYGRDELVKVYEAFQQFRLVVNQKVIKKLLMFRGQTLNFVRIVRFEKPVEKPEDKL